ncbi:hypothetical protein SEA_NIKLAS_1 [Mycobacterium Phage Niklas]|uniref:Gene 1 ring forming protein domain-containing protein n=1 Tax=Mycobacterium Phage Niklas TaxID=2517936 RepID=A0A482JFU0_9CAUD|nr:hypothetical protein I5H04_gp01 [Mycobacterium Phage Niklas]QAY02828.1 hypothetical protein SEA_SHAOBING_1 [Mycobacterium phage Shaobing]QBP31584.1 hypothetical protein SEA_NIKLAS_1 [Mycobacterium Phage Niklas]
MPAPTPDVRSSMVYTFPTPVDGAEVAAREVRLGCAKLAHALHLDGLQDQGATVLETARQLAEFVEDAP